MPLGTINLLPGVRLTARLIDLWMSFIVLNCQVVEWVDIFANPVFKNPGMYIYIDVFVGVGRGEEEWMGG